MTLGEFLVQIGAEYPVSDNPDDLLLEVKVYDAHDDQYDDVAHVSFDYNEGRIVINTE